MKRIAPFLIILFVVVGCGANTKKDDLSKTKESVSEKTYTIHLTKAEFLKKVVNYEANPTEWKYLGDKPAIVDFYATW